LLKVEEAGIAASQAEVRGPKSTSCCEATLLSIDTRSVYRDSSISDIQKISAAVLMDTELHACRRRLQEGSGTWTNSWRKQQLLPITPSTVNTLL
jgi:hypothetical protein